MRECCTYAHLCALRLSCAQTVTLAFVVKEGACVFSALHLVSNVLDVSLIVLGRRCLVWWVLDDNQFVE